MNPEILDNSIKMLKKGLSKSEVLLNVPLKEREELNTLLSTYLSLAHIPKNLPPTPVMRRKYILTQAKQKIWFPFLHISRLAAGSTAFLLLLTLVSAGAVQAFKSTPGQTLFSVKRTAENVRLIFVMSDTAKAELQLRYANSRLTEAESVLKNPSRNKEQEIAAFQELKNQTQIAAESLKQVAINTPLKSSNLPLANQLEDFAKKQNDFIQKTSSEDEEVKLAASGVKDASKLAANQANQIKNYLAVAGATQDPISLADLTSDPNSVVILGDITKFEKSQITVEKVTFQISATTQVQDSSGKKLEPASLTKDTKVKITGTKDDQDQIVAASIIILNPEEPGDVQGSSTTTLPTQTDLTTSTSTKPVQAQDEHVPTPEKPRLGSFIIENPNPQYSP
ncbi:MAG: hypothetical protein JNN11_04615 [Candidatus Doudnabacteria bacterium]|nr:hypothetical protein [Candidatus Doudnabacteria bacterium]